MQTLWQIALPGLLAVLALPFLVPAVASGGFPGLVAGFGRHHAVVVAALVFVVLSAVARHWEPQVLASTGEEDASSSAPGWLGLVLGVTLAASAAWAVRSSVVAPYVVVGPSMLPTLQPDDSLLGRPRLGHDLPARGDVVAFRGSALVRNANGVPWPDVIVKRVIGLPGDRVSMRDGSPVINGWPVPWCDAGEYMYMLSDAPGKGVHGRLRVEFLDDRAYLTVRTPSAPLDEPYEVLPDQVFVLGDNRGNSSDSRTFGAGRPAGVPLAAIDASLRWFLAGTHRSGTTDLGRVFREIDTLEKRVHLEGVAVDALQDGIAKCLAGRPSITHPPPPNDSSAAATRTSLDFGRRILGIGGSLGSAPLFGSPAATLFLANPRYLDAPARASLTWSVP